MRGGEPHQSQARFPWAALLLLGLVTAFAGALALVWFRGVGVVIVATAAALVAGGALLGRPAQRASLRLEQQRRALEASRAELDRSASELAARREELRVAREGLKSALEGHGDREERVLHAERLASVGTLAGGVAHEVNNPLAYVAANLDYVDQQVDALLSGELPFTTAVAEEMRIAIGDARKGILRVRDVVRGMSSFAQASRSPKKAGDPKRELETALSLASNEIERRARLSVHIEEMPLIPDAEHELTQVFVNLLVNAAQSIPEGHAQDHEIRVDARLDSTGGRIRVEISDTGSGIPPEQLTRIFDPFFTTRPVGFGPGLGLATCHGIVRSLGGEIQVESTPGQGSTFRVIIPLVRPAPAAPPTG